MNTFNFDDWANHIIKNLPENEHIEPIIPPLDNEEYNIWNIFGGLHPELPVYPIDINDISDVRLGELSDDDYDASVRGSNKYGFEVWAFYKSIHFIDRHPFPGSWGIFIFETGVLRGWQHSKQASSRTLPEPPLKPHFSCNR